MKNKDNGGGCSSVTMQDVKEEGMDSAVAKNEKLAVVKVT
jgi:hypothetical protein